MRGSAVHCCKANSNLFSQRSSRCSGLADVFRVVAECADFFSFVSQIMAKREEWWNVLARRVAKHGERDARVHVLDAAPGSGKSYGLKEFLKLLIKEPNLPHKYHIAVAAMQDSNVEELRKELRQFVEQDNVIILSIAELLIIPGEFYDVIIIDEAQDVPQSDASGGNVAEKVVLRLRQSLTSSLILIGDSRQQLHVSTQNGIDLLADAARILGTRSVPVPCDETRRCPNDIIRFANRALRGGDRRIKTISSSIDVVSKNVMYDNVSVGDLVICPAVKDIVHTLLRIQEKRAKLCFSRRDFGLLRDFLQELAAMITNGSIVVADTASEVVFKAKIVSLAQFELWRANAGAKWDELCMFGFYVLDGRVGRMVRDSFANMPVTIRSLLHSLDGSGTVDADKVILIGTVASTKGFGADRVFVVKPDGPAEVVVGETPEQARVRAGRTMFVAITRSRRDLFIVTDERVTGSKKKRVDDILRSMVPPDDDGDDSSSDSGGGGGDGGDGADEPAPKRAKPAPKAGAKKPAASLAKVRVDAYKHAVSSLSIEAQLESTAKRNTPISHVPYMTAAPSQAPSHEAKKKKNL
jgi:hypothetical protein